MKATGHHFKITPAVEHGAIAWHRSVIGGRGPEVGAALVYADTPHPEWGRWAEMTGG